MSSPRHFIVLYFPVCFSLCLKIVSDWYANCIYFDGDGVDQDWREGELSGRESKIRETFKKALIFFALISGLI